MERDLKKYRILVTPTTFGSYERQLCEELEASVGEVVYNRRGRPLTSEELRGLLPGCDGLIAGLDRVDRSALEAADRLEVIARYGGGVGNVDLETAAKKGITVTNTPHANAVSVAELAIGLMIALARSIPEAAALVREGKWPRLHGTSFEGKVIGLVGFGSVGREVARRLQQWQATLLAYDPFGDESLARSLNVRLVGLEELTRQSDFVSLHAPLTGATRQMVNADFLSRIKRGAYLVNTARGELVDEGALLAALDSGQLGGAALDVYAEEPPAPDSVLRRRPHLIATPHCGAHTDGAANGMGRESLRDCMAELRGETPLHPVLTQGVKA
jgi:phosphoglycerate dehydrogenase-like enzyme